jgi:Ca2+-binding RTX toxin-like protein
MSKDTHRRRGRSPADPVVLDERALAQVQGGTRVQYGDGATSIYDPLATRSYDVAMGGGADRVTTGDGHDTVLGEAGDDTVRTFAGNDSLDGGTGNDSLDADVGDDTLVGGDGTDSLQGGDGQDSLRGDAGDDRIDAGRGDDVARGGEGRDLVMGSFGDDTLSGGAGMDTIDGGYGNDLISGDGDGTADLIAGGHGSDTFLWRPADGNDTFRGGMQYGSDDAADVDTVVLEGVRAIDVFIDRKYDYLDLGPGHSVQRTETPEGIVLTLRDDATGLNVPFDGYCSTRGGTLTFSNVERVLIPYGPVTGRMD